MLNKAYTNYREFYKREEQADGSYSEYGIGHWVYIVYQQYHNDSFEYGVDEVIFTELTDKHMRGRFSGKVFYKDPVEHTIDTEGTDWVAITGGEFFVPIR